MDQRHRHISYARVNGLHHITAIAGPAQENLYLGVLGMRLVKRSVNQDDPGIYHLFDADAATTTGKGGRSGVRAPTSRRCAPERQRQTANVMPSQHDFNYGILREVAHRPWPMPNRPWIMTQTWHDLLFAHWAVDAALLAPRIPANFTLDLYEGQAWLGIVPFHMTNVAPRFVPALPWLSAFPELNVRTYVRVGSRAGVYFFSLDASNPIAVAAARTLFHLPYFAASMQVIASDGAVRFDSHRTAGEDAVLTGTYRPIGPVFQPVAGTLAHFLTERYCLFTTDRRRRAFTVDIHHPPWPLQQAEASFAANTMADAAGIALPKAAPLLHFAKRQDMVAWRPARI